MSKLSQKTTKAILITVICICVVVGAGAVYYGYNQSQIVVDVQPVSNLAMTWWSDNPVTDGQVTTEVSQNIYLGTSDLVEDILVQKGDKVSPGDPLIQYDTTLAALQSEVLELEIELSKNAISRAENELSTFKKNYSKQISAALTPATATPKPTTSPTPSPSASPTATAHRSSSKSYGIAPLALGSNTAFAMPLTATDGNTDDTGEDIPEDNSDSGVFTPYTGEEGGEGEGEGEGNGEGEGEGGGEGENPAPVNPELYYSLTSASVPFAGTGTSADPYRYFAASGAAVTADFVSDMNSREKTGPIYVKVEMHENNVFTSRITVEIVMIFSPEGSFEFDIITHDYIPPTPAPTPEPTPTPVSTPNPTVKPTVAPTKAPVTTPKQTTAPAPTGDGLPQYTTEQVKIMYIDMQKDLKDMKLNLEQKEMDYRNTSSKVDEGTVESTISGEIIAVEDPETAITQGIAVITVSGGGGYYIQGSISEYDMDGISEGQEVEIMSWRTGEQSIGAVVEVGDMPITSNDYYYGSGASASYYPFTVFVDEGDSLVDGEYVELSLRTGDDNEDSLYLERAYVRDDEEGESYVMAVDEEGKLEKRIVQTGKIIWGTYIEVLDGVSEEDSVAFPYGKTTKEGVKTQPAIDNDFGNYPVG